MNAITAMRPELAVPATPATVLSDVAGITKRNLLHIARTPQLLASALVQPVLFVVLFRYVFGGAINVPGGHYVNYLLPGIFVQVAIFGGTATSVGLSQDLKGGAIDRFRSLPMARSAVLAGRTLADLIRNVPVLALMIAVGVLVGFRFHGSIIGDVGAMLLVLAFGYAFSWVFAAVGLAVKDPETAQIAGLIVVFPLVFASSAFVPVASMPGWLRSFANNQPVSVTVNAVRALVNGNPARNLAWESIVWSAGIVIVFVVVAVRQYSRASS